MLTTAAPAAAATERMVASRSSDIASPHSHLLFASDYTLCSVTANHHTGSVLDDTLREATDIAGDRWVMLALAALARGSSRFGDLQAELGGIAPNILIDRLRRMERDGLVVATLYTHRPRRYAYDLTESGRELAAVLPALAAWAARRGAGDTPRHVTCATPLETTLWCPSCAVAVDTAAPDEQLRWL